MPRGSGLGYSRPMNRVLNHALRVWADECGQAMAEYSTISAGLFLGTAMLLMSKAGPQFLGALNGYLNGIWYTLAVGLP